MRTNREDMEASTIPFSRPRNNPSSSYRPLPVGYPAEGRLARLILPPTGTYCRRISYFVLKVLVRSDKLLYWWPVLVMVKAGANVEKWT
jgi:hypothetical protein